MSMKHCQTQKSMQKRTVFSIEVNLSRGTQRSITKSERKSMQITRGTKRRQGHYTNAKPSAKMVGRGGGGTLLGNQIESTL